MGDDYNWGGAAQGAIGGAEAGAFAGPWGMAIGGGIGGLMGLLGGNGQQGYQDQLKQLAAGYGKRTAPQMTAQLGQTSGFRQNQAGLITQLEAMSRGEGPSAAAIQMREAMDRAASQQTSLAAGAAGRGANAGAAARNAMNNTAGIQAQGARDTAAIRAQEQMAAVGQLSQTLGQARGADESMSQFNAGQQNDASRANMSAVLQQLGLNDESQLRALMMAMGGAGPGMGASIMAGGANAFMPGLNYWQNKNKTAQAPAGGGSVGGAGGYNGQGLPPGGIVDPWA
jgi:hypothetical protein